MVNNTKKMYRTNSKVRQWLIENDFKDINFFPHTRFVKDLHFQGLDFDGLASKGTTLVLFQCKTNRKATKKMLEQYKMVSKRFGILCLWFNNIDRKGLYVNNQIKFTREVVDA